MRAAPAPLPWQVAPGPVILLLAVLLAPVLGAALYRALHGRAHLRRLVDRSVYVAVPLLVAAQVLPHAIEERSLLVIVVLAAGVLLPGAFERASRALAHRTDDLGLVVGYSGLLLHALLEGGAFAPLGAPVEPTFAWAVVLHRVPVGLVVWWLVRPRHGGPLAAAALGGVVGATLLGFLIGNEVLGPVHGPGIELYHAFVSGTLVHVVFHQGRHDHAHHDHDPHPAHDGGPEAERHRAHPHDHAGGHGPTSR